MTLLPTDTLQTVYKYVKANLEILSGRKFELYTSFPKKTMPESLPGTLKELGLAPTCVLVARSVADRSLWLFKQKKREPFLRCVLILLSIKL